MKNRLFSIAAAAAVIIAACGTPQNTTTISSTSSNPAYSIPDNLQTSFTTQYPNATNITWAAYDVAVVPIDWEMTGWQALDADDYAVTYTMGNTTYYSWYDASGAWIGTTSSLTDMSRVPPAILSMVKEKYPDYTIDKVERESWKDQVAYEIKLKKADDSKVKLLVAQNGMVLKEKLKD